MLENVLKKWGGVEVSPLDVYRDMYHLGEHEIQQSGEAGAYRANPIAYYKNRNESHGHFRIMLEDTFEDTLGELQEADFAILNGVTYFGRRNCQEHASKMYAMIFDIDGMSDKYLTAFMSGAIAADAYPVPNYVILSGHGIHLYYIFEYPVALFPNIKIQLKELKYALTSKMWNRYTSKEKKVQYQGINQGFRVIGGKTKNNAGRVRAFRVNQHPWDIQGLCRYVPDSKKVDEKKLLKESRYTREEAKKLFPEWYEKVVVNGDRSPRLWDIAGKVHGDNPHALYDWWIRQLQSGATYGHRYFCIMCLAIYAAKCGVPEDQLKEDAYGLIPYLNGINPKEPFTQEDVDSALECYDLRYCTFPIKDISKLSGIEIVKNKRNGRKQAVHIKYMNNQRAFKVEMGECTNGGRPKGSSPAKQTVKEWRVEHPDGKKADCSRDTGLSKPTVLKWWDETGSEVLHERFTRHMNEAVRAAVSTNHTKRPGRPDHSMTPEQRREYDRLTANATQMELKDFLNPKKP